MSGTRLKGTTGRTTAPQKNEYIEKAIRFYSGYLDTENAAAYLPRVLSKVLEGKLEAFGNRIGGLLFKLAVNDGMMT